MVSKVAVIALVAIVACPILLGYAMNLSEVTKTTYEQQSDDQVNVTPLLYTGSEYTYAAADPIDLNSRLYINSIRGYPEYVKYSLTNSSLRLSQVSFNQTVPSTVYTLSDYAYFDFRFDYNYYQTNLRMGVTLSNNTTLTYNGIHDVSYSQYDVGQGISFTYYDRDANNNWYLKAEGLGGVVNISFYMPQSYIAGTGTFQYAFVDPTGSYYVDLAAGFYLNRHQNQMTDMDWKASVDMPQYTRSLMFTMDFSTITDSFHYFDLELGGQTDKVFRFTKIIHDTTPHWYLEISPRGVQQFEMLTELFYDPTKSSNTYQITLDVDGISLNYVGGWPTLFGKANSYWNYRYDFGTTYENTYFLLTHGSSPLMRFDAAEYRAFQVNIVKDETYQPALFKSNPATTISNPEVYGTSITFGGHTYTVSKGNITLGSHQIPVKGLVFSSTLNEQNVYDNSINGTVVSTTGSPSDITFNGKWVFEITTCSQQAITYNTTEWTPGAFGWDGLDSNFLIVGLLTAIGVFIALGIAIRRAKASLLPLLIVCGGAVVLFFVML